MFEDIPGNKSQIGVSYGLLLLCVPFFKSACLFLTKSTFMKIEWSFLEANVLGYLKDRTTWALWKA